MPTIYSCLVTIMIITFAILPTMNRRFWSISPPESSWKKPNSFKQKYVAKNRTSFFGAKIFKNKKKSVCRKISLRHRWNWNKFSDWILTKNRLPLTDSELAVGWKFIELILRHFLVKYILPKIKWISQLMRGETREHNLKGCVNHQKSFAKLRRYKVSLAHSV